MQRRSGLMAEARSETLGWGAAVFVDDVMWRSVRCVLVLMGRKLRADDALLLFVLRASPVKQADSGASDLHKAPFFVDNRLRAGDWPAKLRRTARGGAGVRQTQRKARGPDGPS